MDKDKDIEQTLKNLKGIHGYFGKKTEDVEIKDILRNFGNILSYYEKDRGILDQLDKLWMAYMGKPPWNEEDLTIDRNNINLGDLERIIDYVSSNIASSLHSSKDFVNIQYDTSLNEKLEAKILNSGKTGILSDILSSYFSKMLRASPGFKELFRRISFEHCLYGYAAVEHPIPSSLEWLPSFVSRTVLYLEENQGLSERNWPVYYYENDKSLSEMYRMALEKPEMGWEIKNIVEIIKEEEGRIRGNNTLSSFLHNSSNSHLQSLRPAAQGSRGRGALGAGLDYYSPDTIRVSNCRWIDEDGEVSVLVFTYYKGSEPRILCKRKGCWENMEDAITGFPFNEGVGTVNAQRGWGQKMAPMTYAMARMDSSAFDSMDRLNTVFYRTDHGVEDPEEFYIDLNGYTEVGNRTFVETFNQSKLSDQISARSYYATLMDSKAYLGGLDGQELSGEGRGGMLAEAKLNKDGRVHKEKNRPFHEKVGEMCRKIFRSVVLLCHQEDSILQESKDPEIRLMYTKFLVPLRVELKKQGVTFEDLFPMEEDEMEKAYRLPLGVEVSAGNHVGDHFGGGEARMWEKLEPFMGRISDKFDKRVLEGIVNSIVGNSPEARELINFIREDSKPTGEVSQQVLKEVAMFEGMAANGAPSPNIPPAVQGEDHIGHLRLHIALFDEAETRIRQQKTLDVQRDRITQIHHGNHIQQHSQFLEPFKTQKEVAEIRKEANIRYQISTKHLANYEEEVSRELDQKQKELAEAQDPKAQKEIEKEIVKGRIKLELSRLEGETQAALKSLDHDRRMEAQKQRAEERRQEKILSEQNQNYRQQIDRQTELEKEILKNGGRA